MQFDCCLDRFEFVPGWAEIVLPGGVMILECNFADLWSCQYEWCVMPEMATP